MNSKKPFFINLFSWILIAFILYFSNWLWFDIKTTYTDNTIIWIIISIIWILLWLIWNNKNQNTKYLKNILIYIEVYLFLIIYFKPWLNFSNREFLILYLCFIWLLYETTHKRLKQRQTKFFSIFYWLLWIFIISIWCFMWYRVPIDENYINEQFNYDLITKFNWNLNQTYTNIYLNEWKNTTKINLNTWFNYSKLEDNKNYTLSFSTQEYDNENKIYIRDKKWNILIIYPQTAVNFSTKDSTLSYIVDQWYYSYYLISEKYPDEEEYLKDEFINKKKNIIFKDLPSFLKDNENFQKFTLIYTKRIWKILPFYKENYNISKQYEKYFDIKENIKINWKIENKKNLIEQNWKIWINNTNWTSKYKEYLKKLF